MPNKEDMRTRSLVMETLLYDGGWCPLRGTIATPLVPAVICSFLWQSHSFYNVSSAGGSRGQISACWGLPEWARSWHRGQLHGSRGSPAYSAAERGSEIWEGCNLSFPFLIWATEISEYGWRREMFLLSAQCIFTEHPCVWVSAIRNALKNTPKSWPALILCWGITQ